MQFAIKIIVAVFAVALTCAPAFAGHHEPPGDAKKDCPYSKSDAACGTGKCAECAKCDQAECDGEKCAEGECGGAKCAGKGCEKCDGGGCPECAAKDCEKCAAAAAAGKDAECCATGAECEAAKAKEAGCPHCGKKN